MCGICGFTFEDKKLLKSMTDLLTHRGPDEQGTFNDKNISLGHRRLSIIDLKTGQQPMANEDETVWIVFNGEIYNYTDLKVELEKKGHTFRTNSDTETIIHGYEEYGVDIVKHLNGCFAFAIWDTPQKKLFIARDRLGIKPLYYTVVKNQIIFASEIKALLSYSQIKRSVNKNALSHFLSFRCNPTEETMFKNIFKLPPGNFLEFEKGNLKKQSYWHLSFNPTKKQVSTNSKQLLEKLKKSVKMRLMSDVPLG
ncbi:MAG: asparagine synthase (glutamine-hydrolyzing), partial [Candidatus Woesearchaeota archaeon]|nr:asparagine synthase (glutamine-hydrolyzing) [Candidatus Woesearchaeota archaeon]